MAAMEGNAWSPPPSPPPPRNKPLPPDWVPRGACATATTVGGYDDFNSSMAVINSIATRLLHGGDELQKSWNNIVREALLAGRFTPRLGASTTSRST